MRPRKTQLGCLGYNGTGLRSAGILDWEMRRFVVLNKLNFYGKVKREHYASNSNSKQNLYCVNKTRLRGGTLCINFNPFTFAHRYKQVGAPSLVCCCFLVSRRQSEDVGELSFCRPPHRHNQSGRELNLNFRGEAPLVRMARIHQKPTYHTNFTL